MPFKIVNETYYTDENENPERYGYIEGYTSNTVGATFLRINCKVTLDEDLINFRKKFCPHYYNPKAGDISGEGVRLNKKQVKQLIKELKKWLRKGY